ncbi:MAG: hypothetical protein JW827_04130 [Spirochaetes bacterium]|nr:hypothetical protein [Spirochaetota bacterium]
MKFDLKNITKRLEFKTALWAASIVFFISFLSGLVNQVSLAILVKRIFISELLFIPIGAGLGFIINHYFMDSIKSSLYEKQPQDNAEKRSEEKVGHSMPQKSEIPVMEQKKKEKGPDRQDIREEAKAISEIEKINLKKEPVMEEPVSDKESMARDDTFKVGSVSDDFSVQSTKDISKTMDAFKETGDKSLGKYIFVNNKKIINDPEVMAKAIRTIMNKE